MASDPQLPWRRTRKPTPEPHVGRIQKRMAKGQSLAEAAEALHLPLWLAKAVFVRSGLSVPRPVHRRAALPQPRITDVQILLTLRVMAVQLGVERGARGSVPLTRKEYDARRDPRQHPSSVVVCDRFGGWTKACEAAGVPVRRRVGGA